jgi:hypothetical protein
MCHCTYGWSGSNCTTPPVIAFEIWLIIIGGIVFVLAVAVCGRLRSKQMGKPAPPAGESGCTQDQSCTEVEVSKDGAQDCVENNSSSTAI